MIREGLDSDSEELIALIASIFAEYPGCVLDVDGEAPHLRRPASAFAGWGGGLWVAVLSGQMVGCVGFADRGDAVELKHLFVAASARRQGLGGAYAEPASCYVRTTYVPMIASWMPCFCSLRPIMNALTMAGIKHSAKDK